MKQSYQEWNPKPATLTLVRQMNAIINEYLAADYKLTMRQLYYQLVARDIVPNTMKSYKMVTGIGNDARLAGMMDWDAIEDRTRELTERAHWESPASVLEACADQFYMDMWETQQFRPLVIVEKEALASVVERACRRLDVPYLAARGYPSVSILRDIAQTYFDKADTGGQEVVIFHLGDHDPSGIDMSRDLEERFQLFLDTDAPGLTMNFNRIALNMKQVHEKNPPPNPAKTTDSRFASYMQEYGDESWELDALDPAYIDDLITSNIDVLIDRDLWEEREEEIREGKRKLLDAALQMRHGEDE